MKLFHGVEKVREALIYDRILELPQGFHTFMTENDRRQTVLFATHRSSALLLADQVIKL